MNNLSVHDQIVHVVGLYKALEKATSTSSDKTTKTAERVFEKLNEFIEKQQDDSLLGFEDKKLSSTKEKIREFGFKNAKKYLEELKKAHSDQEKKISKVIAVLEKSYNEKTPFNAGKVVENPAFKDPGRTLQNPHDAAPSTLSPEKFHEQVGRSLGQAPALVSVPVFDAVMLKQIDKTKNEYLAQIGKEQWNAKWNSGLIDGIQAKAKKWVEPEKRLGKIANALRKIPTHNTLRRSAWERCKLAGMNKKLLKEVDKKPIFFRSRLNLVFKNTLLTDLKNITYKLDDKKGWEELLQKLQTALAIKNEPSPSRGLASSVTLGENITSIIQEIETKAKNDKSASKVLEKYNKKVEDLPDEESDQIKYVQKELKGARGRRVGNFFKTVAFGSPKLITEFVKGGILAAPLLLYSLCYSAPKAFFFNIKTNPARRAFAAEKFRDIRQPKTVINMGVRMSSGAAASALVGGIAVVVVAPYVIVGLSLFLLGTSLAAGKAARSKDAMVFAEEFKGAARAAGAGFAIGAIIGGIKLYIESLKESVVADNQSGDLEIHGDNEAHSNFADKTSDTTAEPPPPDVINEGPPHVITDGPPPVDGPDLGPETPIDVSDPPPDPDVGSPDPDEQTPDVGSPDPDEQTPDVGSPDPGPEVPDAPPAPVNPTYPPANADMMNKLFEMDKAYKLAYNKGNLTVGNMGHNQLFVVTNPSQPGVIITLPK